MLKRKQDLEILRNEHWYRIPVSKMPSRKFHYVAFYEPARFGHQGKCIRFYAQVLSSRVEKRRDLLPNEPHHPSAGEDYVKIQVGRILCLPQTIKNMPPRRVSFGFATLKRFLASKNILQLYRVSPTEQILGRALKSDGITATPQYYVLGGKKRYRLDFAIICKRGLVAIECDNLKAHSGKRQRERDRDKDIFLRRHGWCVIRLTEDMILSGIHNCVVKVRRAVKKLGGSLLIANF
ncbi:MAG TPA: DUF559 domain-containing protein [Candidatus Paceibacterota bacterium]|nr:DUF559 domain-containing protein [Candidatus Paceibacterota bacterium]